MKTNLTRKVDLFTKAMFVAFLLFGFAYVSNAQTVILTENFDALTANNGYISCYTSGSAPTGWTQDSSDDIDWNARSSSTSSSSTGPSGDHTGSGNYMYTETSSCYGKVANLISPSMNLSTYSAVLLEFYYHMYGSAMGTMYVDVSTDGGTTWTQVWTKSGNQGNSWQYASVDLAAYAGGTNTAVKVRFRTMTGTSYTSDMAIDDVKLTQPAVMTYVSSTTTQNDSTAVSPGDADQVVIGVEVQTNGLLTPFGVSQMNFSTAGSTSATDISSAKVYYTGSNSSFSTATQYGSTVTSPSGAFTVSGTQNLTMGTNYFWLVYDISSTATVGNVIDGQCTQITLTGSVGAKTPTVTNPSGSRAIMLVKYVGNGTATNKNLPINPYYGYSYSQSIFTTSQLGGPKVIDTLYYYFSGPGWSTPDAVKIFMGHTTKSAFSGSTDWESLSNLTQVYNATSLAPSNNQGWVKFVLSTPFFYNGSDNLIIAMDENTGGYHGSSDDFYCTSSSVASSIYYYNDNTNPDPASPPSGTTTNYFPNIKLEYTMPAPMSFDTLIVEQNNTTLALAGGENEVVSANVVTSGGLNPFKVSDLYFNTTGTTALTDIDSAKAYYTGSSSQFSASTQFGTNMTTLGTQLHFSDSLEISNGANYFWLVYYIKGSAVLGDFIDGGLDSAVVNGIGRVPTQSNPAGNRKIAGPYSGTYTLGNDSTDDFSSFNNAVNMFALLGVNGPVVVLVDSGTYTEQVTFTTVTGSSATNTITFTSASGNPDDVVLTNAASGSSDNFTLRLDGAQYFKFVDLTIKATNSSYATVVELINGSHNNMFSDNKIMSTGTSYNNRCFRLYNGNNNLNKIINNTITGGYYGVYAYGSSSTNRAQGNSIDSNDISGFYYYGIYSGYQDSISVSYNNIHDNTYNYGYGLYAYYNFNDFKIIGNRIAMNVSSSCTGLRVYYANYYSYATSSTLPGLVANNMISVTGGTSTSYGLNAYRSDNVKYYNNSVVIDDNSSSSRALYQYNTTSNTNGQSFVNNIFVNKGSGYAAYFNTTATVATLDYNNYYSGGTNFVYWSGNKTDLAALKTASSKDANSVSMNPNFFSSTDLHTLSIPMNNLGTTVSGVTTDIDGDPRSATTPDLGADEYTPPANDLSVIEWYAPQTGINQNAAVTVQVKVANFGTATQSNFTIKYSIDGGQNFVSETMAGPITTGDTLTYTFSTTGDFSTYGLYNCMAFTDLTAEQNRINDTIFYDVFACSPFSGAYTLGNDAADNFSSFNDLAFALGNCGVGGPVTVYVDSGYYDENVTFNAVPGASATNTITIKGLGNQTVVSNSSAAYGNSFIFNFDDANFFVLDSLTIQIDSNASYFWGVHFMNAADSNKVMNCTINCGNSTSSNVIGIVASGSLTSYSQNGNNANGLVIENNTINGGYYGIGLRGSSSSNLVVDHHIKNNTISGFYYYGIYNYYCDGSEISGNMISSGANTSNYGYGIYSGYSKNYTQITNNKIDMVKGSTGIDLYRHNYITPNQDTALVANNMIHVADAGSGYGIYNYYSKKVKYLHNSVNITGNKSYSRALYIYSSISSGLVIKNNILANYANGYAIYSTSSASNYENDYNNLYTSGSYIAYQTGSKTDLTAWQTASSDAANSISVDPEFFTYSDLHTFSIANANHGTPLTEVVKDIDGENRSATTPDMGADEYTTPANNLGAVDARLHFDSYCGVVNDSVFIQIKNFGTATQTNVPVSFVGTTPTGNVSLTGTIASIASLQSVWVYMGQFTATTAGMYNLKAYATLTTDTIPSNDTISGNLELYTPETIGYGEDFSTWSPMHWDMNGGGSFTWAQQGGSAAYADFWSNNSGNTAQMISPAVTLPANNTAYVGFKYAYTGQYINSYADSLAVMVQACGDTTWTPVWFKGGADLVTPGGGSTTPGTYMDANAIIPASMQGSNVRVMFNAISDYGPNLFIDDMSVFNAPMVALGNDTAICTGDTITLDAGVFTGASYMWTRGLDTLGYNQTLDVTTSGSYVAHVSQYGVAGTDAINVTFNALPTLYVNGLATSYCENEAAVTLSPLPVGGVFSGNGIIGNDFDPAMAGLGNQDITYAYTDANGCSNTVMVSTMVKAIPMVTTTATNATICAGTSTILTSAVPAVANDLFISEYIEGSSNNKAMEIFNGTGDTVYLDNYQIAQATNGNGWAYYHAFPAGSYILDGDVWVIVTDQIYSTLFDTANADEILSYPSLVHFNGDDARALIKISATDTTFLDIIGTPDYDPGSGWDVAGVANATKNHTLIRKPTVLMGDTSWTNIAGTDSVSSQYYVLPQNTFTSLGSHQIMGNANYVWSNGATTAATQVSPLTSMDYYVTVTGSNQCQTMDTISISVLAAPMVNLGSDQTLCASETAMLDAGAGMNYNYMWSNGDTTQTITADSTGIGVGTGNYSVVVTDSNMCMATDTVALTFLAEPVVNIMGPDTAKYTHNISLDAGTGFASYMWSNGWTNQTILLGSKTLTPNADTSFNVEVMDANGCKGYDTITFYVINDVGFGENALDMELDLYPNPNKGKFNIAINGYTGKLEMNVLDVSGKVIRIEQLDVRANFVKQFDMSTLAKGAYYIKFISEDGVKIQKLIIQ